MKNGSVSWAVACALSYFYMVSAWGGYVYIINLIPLHVLGLAFFLIRKYENSCTLKLWAVKLLFVIFYRLSHLSSSSYG